MPEVLQVVNTTQTMAISGKILDGPVPGCPPFLCPLIEKNYIPLLRIYITSCYPCMKGESIKNMGERSIATRGEDEEMGSNRSRQESSPSLATFSIHVVSRNASVVPKERRRPNTASSDSQEP